MFPQPINPLLPAGLLFWPPSPERNLLELLFDVVGCAREGPDDLTP